MSLIQLLSIYVPLVIKIIFVMIICVFITSILMKTIMWILMQISIIVIVYIFNSIPVSQSIAKRFHYILF